jgi:hypothetical protein
MEEMGCDVLMGVGDDEVGGELFGNARGGWWRLGRTMAAARYRRYA